MQNECVDLEDQVLERIDDGIFILGRDWRIIYLNKAAADIVGKDPRDCLGKVFWEAHPELIGTPIEQAYRSAMERGEESRLDAEGIDGDILFEIAILPILLGVMVHLKDVTELREALFALEESEMRYQGLFENLHEAVSASRIVLDENGEVVDWEWLDANTGVETALGRRKCELIGMRISQMYEGGDIPAELLSAVREMRRTKSPVSIESYQDPIANGAFHVSFLPLSDDIFYRMSIDITGLKNAQVQAEEDRARLQAITDNTPVAVGITDAKGAVTLENGVLEKIWGGPISLTGVTDYSKCRAWWPHNGEPVAPEDWPAARALRGETAPSAIHIVAQCGRPRA